MPIIVPTLNFGGQCEEALQLYKKAFQAEVLCLLRYEDGNKEDCHWNLSEEQKKYIYHAELLIGEQRIMMCDNIDVPFQTSMATFLTVSFDTKEEVEAAYEVMKEGSQTIYEIGSTTYSSCRVVFVDKFGLRWGVMTEQTER